MFKVIGLTSSKDDSAGNDANDHKHDSGDGGAAGENHGTNGSVAGPGGTNSHKGPHSPRSVRESEDFDAIYRSVSNISADTSRSHKRDRRNVSRPGEEDAIVGNPLSFLTSRNGDPLEYRYGSDEEQDQMESRFQRPPEGYGDDDDERDDDDEDEADDPANSPVRQDVTGSNGQVTGNDAQVTGNDAQVTGNDANGVGGTGNGTDSHVVSPTGSAPNDYDNDFNDRPHDHLSRANQTLSSFIPHMFRSEGEDDEDEKRARRKFNLFRKRTKDKKHSVVARPDEMADEEDWDQMTGERAQNLVNALVFGSSSISLVASCLLEDETGISRAPLLLSLLGFRITDISNTIFTKNRKFRIDLEYGVSPQRIKWSVEKTAKDLLYLHSRFKLDNWRKEVVRNKNSELPKYPIPPLRRNNDTRTLTRQNKNRSTNLGDESEAQSMHEDVQSAVSIRQLANLRAHLSNSSMSSTDSISLSPELVRFRINKNQEYINHVANYLNELIKLVALKPQSNRLFHFFEISPISSLLNYETGYIGKQGVIHIGGTAKSQGWRVGHFKANDLKGMIDRRSEKWFLIRNSYVMYVSDINSTLPLEVFLVDHKFKISYKGNHSSEDDESDYDDSSLAERKMSSEHSGTETHGNPVFKYLKINIENSERKLSLLPKSEKEQKLWIKSLYEMKNSTVWSKKNRFDSFAPVRDDCYAQWFVDGRDYFWAISSAIEMAKDVVYIHDWWLSPELYLRRPANCNQQWRLDRLLQRKARQGVKIFVIVYRNVGSTVSTDSLYTKHSLLSLHDENIHVLRSPNQLLQNTYFWAHHEKLCIVDHNVAFIGGIDLCYGRYDTPDHVLVDDSEVDFEALQNKGTTGEDLSNFQIFPGKDYSNARVKDFFQLEKPYESMYDRKVTPRMPWHDVHMLTSGKVARDLSRHFVQRWNYLLRQKRPSRYTPLLTPPPDFTKEEEERLNLGGTCEVQLLRSSGNWSLGLKEHEQSIQNAYLKLIETSEHFVYIENQFFVTSCEIDGNEIENRIGDALVDRIIRAHNEGTQWRAVIVIPLMPGFESQVDQPDGSSVRVIMQCQYMSISRGQTSIFAKLKRYGIEPEDYIQFFSLRKWGIIGPDRNLVTEQLYIHAKTMIVDDRAAIIGSANINERSMRGVRDSEMAALVRDRETIQSKMGDKDFTVGKFAHSLRIRLMREHLGIHVDIVDVVERRFRRFEEFARTSEGIKAATNNFKNTEHRTLSAMVELATRDILGEPEGTFRWKHYQKKMRSDLVASSTPLDDINVLEADSKTPAPVPLPISFNNRTGTHEANRGIRDKKKHSYDARVQHSETHKQDVYGFGPDKYKSKLARKARLNSTRFLKQLSQKVMKNNPQATVLPELEDVAEFLESDDFDMTDEMDEESENIIAERNKERWKLLKKISYLQRVCAQQRENQEEENKKRAKAGMPPQKVSENSTPPGSKDSEKAEVKNSVPGADTTLSSDDNDEGIPSPTEVIDVIGNASAEDKTLQALKENGNVTANGGVHNTPGSVPGSAGLGSAGNSGLKPESSSSAEYSDDIPIISLSESGIRSLIDSLKPKHAENFTTFVDPYQFEDPLSVDFYEDLWFEHARRNTEIFRMIFHTQPDDTVTSWREYKQFAKLQKAFTVAQAQEAKKRRDKSLYGENISESDTESETESTTEELPGGTGTAAEPRNGKTEKSRKSKKVQRHSSKSDLLDMHNVNGSGVLGEGPPSIRNNVSKQPSLKFVYNNRIPEEEEHHGEAHANGTFDTDSPVDDKEEGKEEGLGILTETRGRRGPSFSARRKMAAGDRVFDRETAERILNEVQGNLVVFPADWLMRELEGGNWFYNTDRIPPIDIYD